MKIFKKNVDITLIALKDIKSIYKGRICISKEIISE